MAKSFNNLQLHHGPAHHSIPRRLEFRSIRPNPCLLVVQQAQCHLVRRPVHPVHGLRAENSSVLGELTVERCKLINKLLTSPISPLSPRGPFNPGRPI